MIQRTIQQLMEDRIFDSISDALVKFEDCEYPPTHQEINNILRISAIRFVKQESCWKDFSDWYEPRIFLRGEVQTRDHSWHDFFNACVWSRFPKTKGVINRLQYELQKSHYPSKKRTPAENMLALFDENGSIIMAKDESWLEAIKEHRWHEIFWKRRSRIKDELKVIVFGHGLFEKAVNPYIGLTTPSLMFVGTEGDCIDRRVSRFIDAKGPDLVTSDLSPFPVLGMPGFWPGNDKEEFYFNNSSYFRKKRKKQNEPV